MKKYTESHEWVVVERGIGTIGVTDYAQKELGEIVYVELPELNADLKAGQEAAVLESTKAAADVYSPVSGQVIEINRTLANEADRVNRSPEQDGWLFRVSLADPGEVDSLLDEQGYKRLIAG
jgi:glycine cleavage system H protein